MKRPAKRVADLLNPAATLLPAANVIMQLSLPGVGYGVLESPVDSGNVYKHPFKRARHHRHLSGRRDHRHRLRPGVDLRGGGRRPPAGAVQAVKPGVLQRF